MILGSAKQVSRILENQPYIRLVNQPIEMVTEARNLGVIFESNLRFEKHIQEAVRNCFYRLKILYTYRPFLSEDMRVRLCETLVLSKLNYADTVFGSCLLARTVRQLQRVQNACARFCFSIPPREHVTPFLNNSNLLKMQSRRMHHFATLLFDIIHTKTPEYLYYKINWAKNNNKYHTRAAIYMIQTPQHRTAAFRGSFKYSASKCWNNLPPPIRTLKSRQTFSTSLKSYLLELQKSS